MGLFFNSSIFLLPTSDVYELTITDFGDSEGGNVTPGWDQTIYVGNIDKGGHPVEIHAVPDPGYNFYQWNYVGNVQFDNGTSFWDKDAVIHPESDAYIYPIFQEK